MPPALLEWFTADPVFFGLLALLLLFFFFLFLLIRRTVTAFGEGVDRRQG